MKINWQAVRTAAAFSPLALLVVACVLLNLGPTVDPATLGPLPTGTPASFSALAPNLAKLLANVQSVEIQDNWNGNYDLAPLTAKYSLLLVAGQYSGSAQFAQDAWSLPTARATATADVLIPQAVLVQASQVLLNASARTGEYEATPSCCDDYPNITIRLASGADVISLTSISPYNEWGGATDNRTFVITSDAARQMLHQLNPYLARDIEKEMFGQDVWH